MRVRWLNKALQNLEDEAAYIAKDDPRTAGIVVQRVFKQVDKLADNPALGRPGRIHGTRELVVLDTRYIIPYRVRPGLDQVEILRVLHTSRKLPARW
jgi:toxin ParE1/3/4